MRRWRAWVTDDRGSAALEFITVGVILLVPLVYLVIVLGAIQQQTLGVEAAARHTARAISQAPDAETAVDRSDAVLTSIVEQYDIDYEAISLGLRCTTPGDCPSAGATIVVTVTTRVSLPFVPPVFGLDRAVAIPVQAEALQKMSREWGGG